MSTIINYVRETCSRAPESIGDVLGETLQAVGGGMILGAPTWLSRRIDDWSHRTLPPASAKVVSAVIVSVPFIALDLLAPAEVIISVHIGLGVVRAISWRSVQLITKGEGDSLNRLAPVHGLGLTGVIYGVANGILTHNRSTLTKVCWIPSGLLLLSQSGFIGDCANAAGELLNKIVQTSVSGPS